MENKIMIHFEALKDPRQQGKVLHPMRNIVFIVLVGCCMPSTTMATLRICCNDCRPP